MLGKDQGTLERSGGIPSVEGQGQMSHDNVKGQVAPPLADRSRIIGATLWTGH